MRNFRKRIFTGALAAVMIFSLTGGMLSVVPGMSGISLTAQAAEPCSLTITNNTAMFKIASAEITTDAQGKKSLTLVINSVSYSYMIPGTYEDAVSVKDDRDEWIAGVQENGKTTFIIPLTDGVTYMPIVSVSSSKVAAYDAGTGELEKAFMAREFTLDYDQNTLVTDDYHGTVPLTMTDNAPALALSNASLTTVGGPSANNYSETLILFMQDDTYSKAVIASAEDAVSASDVYSLTDSNTFEIPVKQNQKGGTVLFDYLDKDITVSFYSTASQKWVETTVNVSKDNKTVSVSAADAASTVKVTLDKSSETLAAGKTVTLTAALTPDNAGTVTWSSSDNAVATVENGVVTAVAPGSTVITAACGGSKAQCAVTVTGDKIIEGAAGSWEQESTEGLTIVSDAELSDFTEVRVDGQAIASENYTLTSGSTKVTLKPAYLATLTVGEHTFCIVSKTGEATTTLTILEKASSTQSIEIECVMQETGAVSGMYGMENVVVTKQADGTYLVRMHQKATNRNLLALTDDIEDATDHAVDWYKGSGSDGYWFVIPVETLSEPLVYCMSSEERAEAGKSFGNPVILTFKTGTLANSTESDVTESEIVVLAKQSASAKADYTAVDTALSKVPSDLTIYTSKTVYAVNKAVSGVVRGYSADRQAEVDAMASAINSAVKALVKKTDDTEDDEIKDGTYTVEVGSSALMFRVVNAVLTVKNGKMTAVITLSGSGYDKLYMGKASAAAKNSSKWIKAQISSAGEYSFTIPVSALDQPIAVAAYGVKGEKWYDRDITFVSATLTAGTSENKKTTGDTAQKKEEESAATSEEEINAMINSVQTGEVVDGTYTPSFGFTGGTGKLKITCPTVVVENGKATATLQFSSSNITWAKVNGVKYYNENSGGEAVIHVPVELNTTTSIIVQTTAMSQPHDVDYVLYVYVDGQNVSDIAPTARTEETETVEKNTVIGQTDEELLDGTTGSVDTDNPWGAFDSDQVVTTANETQTNGLNQTAVIAIAVVIAAAAVFVIICFVKKALFFSFLQKTK